MAATMPLTPDGPRQAQGSAARRGMDWPWACSAASTVGTSRNGVFPAPVLRSPPVITVGEGGRRQAQRPGRGSGRRWPAAGKRLRGGLHGIEAVVEQTESHELRSWRNRLHLAKPRFTALQRVMERTGVPGAGSCRWRSLAHCLGWRACPHPDARRPWDLRPCHYPGCHREDRCMAATPGVAARSRQAVTSSSVVWAKSA